MKVEDIKKGDWFYGDYEKEICVRIINEGKAPLAWAPCEDQMNHPQYMCSLTSINQYQLDSGGLKPIPCPEKYKDFKWRDEEED